MVPAFLNIGEMLRFKEMVFKCFLAIESVRTVNEQDVGIRYKGSLLRPGICANIAFIEGTGQVGEEPSLGMKMVRTCLLF